jgi:hypothetical protein
MKHLLKYDGGYGREGAEMKRLSKVAKVSVHMLQSVARGRRNFSDAAAKRVERAMAKAK